MKKIVILGAGHVGSATALYLAERNLGEIVLLDIINYGLAAGKAVDLAAAAALRGFSVPISGTDKIEAAADASIVINTAGVPRKPGMDRMDILRVNAEIAHTLGKGIRQYAPDAVVINVANPLDVVCYVLKKTTGFPRERVVGMAGVLDSARFRAFLADELGCAPEDVSAMVLGGHGDSMVPIVRTATVGGVPITELLAPERIRAVVERTRNAGAEIVKLLQTGSAFMSTGASTALMVEACLSGRSRLLAASAYLEGEYGLRDLYLGVPILFGERGMQKIIEIELTPAERQALAASAAEVRRGIEALPALYREGSALD